MRESPATVLSLEKVCVAFGRRPVLSDISFDVAGGEFVCVVGPSGCGKTTLIRLLAGLLAPSGGEIVFNGARLAGTSRDRAIIFQDYSKALLPWRTVAGNIALALEAGGVADPERGGRVEALLAKMRLAHAAAQYPGQLSGGMQQRVQIARCLAQQPKLLLMDEPFGALDAITRDQMGLDFHRLSREEGKTVLFITHSISEAVFLSNRVVVMSARPGKIEEIVPIGLGSERHFEIRDEPEFARYTGHIRRLFEKMGVLKERRHP